MSLQNTVIKSMAWSSVGQFVSISVAFVSNLVLAHLLSPDDFGCIGMLTIFLSISAIFVNGGFGMALIQKKNTSHVDYSTIFYWNLAVSIICVVILFFAAPYIANFYHIPLLRDVLRVLSLELILTALAIVPTNQLKKHFQFKQLALRTIVSTIIATAITITLAFKGFGVWSLVAMNLTKNFIILVMLWNMTTWRPNFEFSIKAWKEMFGFGSMMLLSNLINTIYININGLIIGRLFSAERMGFYAQARKLEEIPSLSLSAVINEVSFSAFASIQDQKDKLISALRKNVLTLSFLCYPIFFMMIELASDIIPLLFGNKWMPAVPYFRILALGSMLYTINSVYESVVKALGKGKLFFIAFTSTRIMGLALICAGIPFGVEGMLWGMTIAAYLTFGINMIIVNKLIGYSLVSQLGDMLPSYLLSISILLIVHFSSCMLDMGQLLSMVLKGFSYAVMFLFGAKLLKMQGMVYIYEIVLKKMSRK